MTWCTTKCNILQHTGILLDDRPFLGLWSGVLVCCSVSQCVVMYCTVLHCDWSSLTKMAFRLWIGELVDCSVLQRVAVCCNVLRSTRPTYLCLQQQLVYCSVLQRVAMCCALRNRLACACNRLYIGLQLTQYIVAVGELSTHYNCNHVLSQLQ